MRAIANTRPICALALLLVGLLALPTSAMVAQPNEILEEAVSEYRAALDCADRDERLERFRRAEMLFARLTAGKEGGSTGGIHNPDLYVNLGNAALGAEQLGPAILAYRRALVLDPDHHRARQNIAHARSLLPDWIPRPEESGFLDTFFAWTGRLSSSELQMLAAVAFMIAAAMVAASIRWRQPILRNLAVLPGIAWVFFLGMILIVLRNGQDDAAVIVVPEVIARSADSAGAPPRFPQPLPSGTEVRVLETRDDWTRVRLFDGRDAWLPSSAAERVVPL